MITGMEAPIEAPSLVKRRLGLLIDAAEPITLPARKVVTDGVESIERPPLPVEQVGRGLTFTPYGCTPLERLPVEMCEDPAAEDDTVAPDGPVFEAFGIRTTESCSALDIDLDWLNGRIETRWGATLSEALAAELATGENSGASPSLANSATVLTATEVEVDLVMAALEDGLADTLHGAAGMIHLAPYGFAAVTNSEWVDLVDGRWVTRTGHIVVSDPGYRGAVPDGESADPTVEWAFASGIVGYAIGKPYFTNQNADEYLDRTRNIVHGRKLATAVVAFDPCSVVAVSYAKDQLGS